MECTPEFFVRMDVWEQPMCPREFGRFCPKPGRTRDRRDPSSLSFTVFCSLSLSPDGERAFQHIFDACDVCFGCTLTRENSPGAIARVNRDQERIRKGCKAGDLRHDQIERGYGKDAPRDSQREEG